MSISELKSKIQDYAKDIKLNLSGVLSDESTGLTAEQVAVIALASAYATKNTEVIKALENEYSSHSEDIKNAAKSAASIMAMNNIYYRFVHLSSDKEYGKMPAGLRMNVLAKPPVDKIDFELASLAVSAINGCGLCIDSHVAQIAKDGVSKQAIQHSIRIAATINAVDQALVI